MPNKDPKDLHLDSRICTLGFEGENKRKVIQFTSIFMLLTQGIISLQYNEPLQVKPFLNNTLVNF